MTVRVVVTGGAGFLGSHVVDELVKMGCEVAVLDSLVSQVHGVHPVGWWPSWVNPAAQYTRGDVRDRAVLAALLATTEPHVVVHLASEVGVGQAEVEIERYVDANVRGTAVLAEQILAYNDKVTADRDGIRRVIVAGSMSSYGEGSYVCPEHGPVRPAREADRLINAEWTPACPYAAQGCVHQLQPIPIAEWASLRPAGVYAATKRDQEELVAMSLGRRGCSVATARFFNLYGPRQSPINPYTGVAVGFATRVRNGVAPVVYEDGGQLRDFTHVLDAASAVAALVGSWQWAMASRRWADPAWQGPFNVGTGTPTSILSVAQLACAHAGAPVPLDPDVSGMCRNGDVRACYADTSRLRATGWTHTIEAADGLRELFETIAAAPPVAVADLDVAHNQVLDCGAGAIMVEPSDAEVQSEPAAWGES
jgi:dTDP-L-rhamnose 4-epimerase